MADHVQITLHRQLAARDSTNSRSKRPTLIFVHHFGGNQNTSRRHQDFFNSHGYDTASFTLSWTHAQTVGLKPSLEWIRLLQHSFWHGLIETWTQELKNALDQTDGPKIIYSFSFPSVTVPSLLSQDPRQDVWGWICDGGPFVQTRECITNFFTYIMPIQNQALRKIMATSMHFVLGGSNFDHRARGWLAPVPPDLPILSLRNRHDRLVPVPAIEMFFELNPRLHPQVQIFESGDHLEAMRAEPELFAQRTLDFIKASARL